jgi:hypothetical protein
VLKSGITMFWGHVALIQKKGSTCRILVEQPEGKKHWEDLEVDGIIILK